MDALAALRRYFGHSAFRPGQEALIDALLQGRDVLGVMPTGAGKSVCYQIPALLLPGVTIVVSPLISLMKDQVAALTQAGVPAAFLNSSLTADQYREVLRRARAGAYRLLYVAPERLLTSDFLQLADAVDIPLVAVDEAHCVSQWGQDFRPSYLKIPELISRLPRRPAVGAFTATATLAVKEDIAAMLGLEEPVCLTTGFDRPNLYFGVVRPRDKSAYVRAYLEEHPGGSGIVYCATRKAVESVCAELRGYGVSATRYHAGLEEEERRTNQEDFVYDRVRVMVATNAFGMGIDKSNVSFVLQYNMPQYLESYSQEAGRAGRDGEAVDCILLFSAGDVQTARFLLRNAEENEALTPEERETVYRRELDRLEQMTGYCKTSRCLRAYLLAYFGEAHAGNCGHCSSCKGDFVEQDITVQAQQILSGVARVEKRYPYGLGVTLIVRMLHGSREQRVLQLGLDGLSTYGIMKEMGRQEIRSCIDHLVETGYLELTQGEYPVLHLTPRSGDVLFRGAQVMRAVRRRDAWEQTADGRRRARSTTREADVEDAPLLADLKRLRSRLAQQENVPSYIVFSNATLSDMAARRPRTMEEFLDVSGVGEVKASRYGRAFLDLIRAYLDGAEPE